MVSSVKHEALNTDLWTGLILLVIVVCRLTIGSPGQHPSFDESSDNVTVVAGQDAVLRCSISHLGKYKVVWLDQRGFPLTYEDLRVIDDERFSVVRPFIKDWNLLITDVLALDRGQYRCTINTEPILCKTIELHVKVPPQIIDSTSSSDITTREGASVILACYVTGVPKPEVTWYRRFVTGKTTTYAVENLGTVGERFHIQNITRFCGYVYSVYECHVSNGVPPAVRRQIRLRVEYAPKVTIINSTIGQRRGSDVILDCSVTAFPLDEQFWERNGRTLVEEEDDDDDDDGRMSLTLTRDTDHKVTVQLTIRHLTSEDFGDYKCVAQNSRGRSEATATVYECMDSEEQQIDAEMDRSSATQQFHPTTGFGFLLERMANVEKNSQVFVRRMTEHSSPSLASSAASAAVTGIGSTQSSISSSSFSVLFHLTCALLLLLAAPYRHL